MAPDRRADMTELLTAAEVAAILRCDPAAARQLMRAGRLEASKICGRWLVTPAALDTLIAESSNRTQSAHRRRRRRR